MAHIMDHKGPKHHSKLCVCGRSQTYPLCDNSHQDEDWSCATASAPKVSHGFCAPYRYQNLAMKLAAHYDGVSIGLQDEDDAPGLEHLVILVDGSDARGTLKIGASLRYERCTIVCFGHGGALLERHLPGAQVLELALDTAPSAFGLIRRVLDGQETVAFEQAKGARTAFLSHAVADEALLMPAVESLQTQYGVDLFTCAEAIPTGARWHDAIMDALRDKEVFVVLLSQAFARSTFCAFEVGCAYGLGKPMVAISLDGSAPPAFIQHLQMVDLPRQHQRRPWMTPTELLTDALLGAVLPSKED